MDIFLTKLFVCKINKCKLKSWTKLEFEEVPVQIMFPNLHVAY